MAPVTDFEQMWRDLEPVGRSSSGGWFRQPFTAAEREATEWFLEQAAARDLEVESDPVGNLVAWWRPAGTSDLPGVLTGSHLDSVLDGGAYDGPLGVVSALAAVDRLRERGFTPGRPLGISVFVEEEGSRFGLACLGSRLATGATTWEQARDLRDRDGLTFAEALERAGLHGPGDPAGAAWTHLHDRVACYVELHVEQGRELADRGAPVGVGTGIWPHGRYRLDFTGQANHAGTTRMEDRHDPMLTYAMTVLAANKQARLSGQRATFGRVDVRPNGTNAIPSRVTAWLDARAESPEHLDAMLAQVERLAAERAERDGTGMTLTTESVSAAVAFDPDLGRRVAAAVAGGASAATEPSGATGAAGQPQHVPLVATAAGHDAGILQTAGVPTAMLFVRNPTGVSHAPEESASTEDCLAGVEALADALAELAGPEVPREGER